MPHVDADEQDAGTAAATATAAAGAAKTDPVKTADTAPVIPYAGSAAVASLLAMGLFLVRTRKDPDVM